MGEQAGGRVDRWAGGQAGGWTGGRVDRRAGGQAGGWTGRRVGVGCMPVRHTCMWATLQCIANGPCSLLLMLWCHV